MRNPGGPRKAIKTKRLFMMAKGASRLRTVRAGILSKVCVAIIVQRWLAQPRSLGANLFMHWEGITEETSDADNLVIKLQWDKGRRKKGELYLRTEAGNLSKDAKEVLRERVRERYVAEPQFRASHWQESVDEDSLWEELTSSSLEKRNVLLSVKWMYDEQTAQGPVEEVATAFPQEPPPPAPPAPKVYRFVKNAVQRFRPAAETVSLFG